MHIGRSSSTNLRNTIRKKHRRQKLRKFWEAEIIQVLLKVNQLQR